MSSGPPLHGNYAGYYSKRPYVSDPRLALLPKDTFRGKRVLDVGCNEGWMTCEIAQSYGADKVIGVDLDEKLIRAAWRRRLSVWCMQAPVTREDRRSGADEVVGEYSRKRKPEPPTSNDQSSSLRDYFPAEFEHTLGPLPIPSANTAVKSFFPHNIAFRVCDWCQDHIHEDEEGYDVVLGFSITKWIHLNTGDQGLTDFFRRVFTVLAPGGIFILEPQPWENYKKAKKMDERLKRQANTLELRPDDFPNVLGSIGFQDPVHYGEVGDGGFRRPIDVYRKPPQQ